MSLNAYLHDARNPQITRTVFTAQGNFVSNSEHRFPFLRLCARGGLMATTNDAKADGIFSRTTA